MSKVEALGTHFCANAATFNLQNKIAKSSVSKVEVPHVLECTLIHLTGSTSTNWASERISSIGSTGHPLNDVESTVKQLFVAGVGLNGLFNVNLHCLPHILEGCLRRSQFATVMIQRRVDREFVVGTAISEVQTRRDGEVGLQSDGQLIENPVSRG